VSASAPLDAAQQAVEHTRRHLFPFRFERWLALGFVAFLDQCGRSGGSSFNVPAPGGFGDTGRAGRDVEAGLAWLAAHVVLVSLIAAVVLAFTVAFIAVVLWVNSRGVFMYLDDVASGRTDVARPWREHASHASSYFAWSFGLSMVTLTAVLLLVAAMTAVGVVMVRGRPPTVVLGVSIIVALALLLLGLVFAFALASVGLRDFVAPLQLATRQPCAEAIRLFVGLLRAHPGVFVVYVLLKIVVTLAVGVAAMIVGCSTCCCGFLPVVAQTVLQPAHYFERAWPLYVLRPLGYDLLAPGAPTASEPPGTKPFTDINNTRT
jgi:hypothetical protein